MCNVLPGLIVHMFNLDTKKLKSFCPICDPDPNVDLVLMF